MDQEKKRIVILRGIPGAGKSTYTQKHFPDAIVCSADNFFVNKQTGEYKFKPELIGHAHNACRRKFEQAIKTKEPLIVVDCTNTMLKEFQPYIQLAQANDYEVEVVRLQVSPETSATRNLHGVPLKNILKIQQRFADYPGEQIVSTE
jgi:predicted kinase